MTIKIELNAMKFYAFHGVAPQERKVGNHFVVDIRMETNVSRATQSDDIRDTVNYAEVYTVVKREMERPSLLLEAVAGRILHSIKQEFPQVRHLCVKVAKLNPPFGGDVESAAVLLEE